MVNDTKAEQYFKICLTNDIYDLGDIWIKACTDDCSHEGFISGVSVCRIGLYVLRVDELHLVQMFGELALHVLFGRFSN